MKALLMGGQACVLYGAAEFSRDTDLAILATESNLHALRSSLAELRAKVIAVPPFELDYLLRGHAVHFRCESEVGKGMRVDIMTKMRGVDSFPEVWARRTTFELSGVAYDALSLPDLVKAKKTQRDKDWPMIRRLVEASFYNTPENPTNEQIAFWLAEMRTPELLIQIVRTHRSRAEELEPTRKALKYALEGEMPAVISALSAEEEIERALDQRYWAPLKAELEQLRQRRRQNPNV